MSLLLDALKKAAEQKAEKSKAESPEIESSDETVIDAAPEDISGLQSGDSSNLQIRRRDTLDQTEIDHSEIETQLDRTRLEQDETKTDLATLSEQLQTGEDETIIIADEDVSEFLGEPEIVSRGPEDETDLSEIDGLDASQTVLPHRGRAAAPTEDETDLSEVSQRVDEDDKSQVQYTAPADDTELSRIDAQLDEVEQSQVRYKAPGDDTELSQIEASPDDDTGAVRVDDPSLLSRAREETNLTAPTSVTDPQRPEDQARALQVESDDDDNLALVDTTRHQAPSEEASSVAAATQTSATATQTSATATTGVALNTLTTESTTTRADSTSTRTYAPDNYDRTLMKLPGEDASKLFAGMKSDSDVVMTPDYAKKVFQSKSSAQRIQHYKVYGGIAFAILLALGIYGLFEMQEEAFNIETSLRPLKRDPLPGLIKPASENSAGGIENTGVDAKTIELVEGAEGAGEAAGIEEVMEESTGGLAAAATGQESEVVVEVEPKTIASSGTIANQQSVGQESFQMASVEAAPTSSQSGSGTSTLEISSNRRLDKKNLLLREAYAAYQAGDDEIAMGKYNQVLKIDPGNRNALLARAAINVQNHDSLAAIKDYQALLLANPKDSLAMTSMLTVANYSPQETASQLKLMIRDEPESPYLNFALANVYGAQNRWQEAQGYYFKALEYNPDDPNYAYNLAVSLEHISKPQVAISYYRRALDNFENGLAIFSKDVVGQRLEKLGKL